MKTKIIDISRRQFVKKSAKVTLASSALIVAPKQPKSPKLSQDAESLNFIGPKPGFTPQIGTLVSMLNWMRSVILNPVLDMGVKDLDYLHDDKSNTIGAMLWHLAATEKFYQLNTFEGIRWGDWDDKEYADWNVAMDLGNTGRRKIKGNKIDFYLELLADTRENTLKELAKRDDDWLLQVDPDWGWGAPTNNYCKWFHVCEHESNHNGQIKYIKSRIS